MPVEVKVTPHSYPFAAWAVCASPKDELFVMDSDEQWHQVELEDLNPFLSLQNLDAETRDRFIQNFAASLKRVIRQTAL